MIACELIALSRPDHTYETQIDRRRADQSVWDDAAAVLAQWQAELWPGETLDVTYEVHWWEWKQRDGFGPIISGGVKHEHSLEGSLTLIRDRLPSIVEDIRADQTFWLNVDTSMWRFRRTRSLRAVQRQYARYGTLYELPEVPPVELSALPLLALLDCPRRTHRVPRCLVPVETRRMAPFVRLHHARKCALGY